MKDTKQKQIFEHHNLDILQGYTCSEPVYRMHVMQRNYSLCCGHWNSVIFPPWRDETRKLMSLRDMWTHPLAEELRQSVIVDKDYKYCHNTQCPYLQNPDLHMTKNHNNRYVQSWKNNEFFIPILSFDVDDSCQLKCPSCRLDYIYNRDIMETQPPVKQITEEVLYHFDRGNIQYLNMNSTGDPFISPACVYLMDNVKGIKDFSEIHLHTNGLKFTKRWWDNHENLHDMVKHLQISLDAGDKESYEKVRLGGNWETIIENIDFFGRELSHIDITLNLILQANNYKSVPKFIEIAHKYNFHANIMRIAQWGHLTDEAHAELAVWKEGHPQHADYVDMIKSLPDLSKIRVSFGNLINGLKQYRNDMK